MFEKILTFILLVCLLTACSQNEDNNSMVEKQEGFIAKIEKEASAGRGHKGWYSMLLIPDVEDIDISKKAEDELDLDIGIKIIVYWDGSEPLLLNHRL